MVPRVAVIDDDPFLLDLIADVLDERKWMMVALPDGTPVTDWLLQEKPDVILLDVRLGGTQTGWDVLREIQVHPKTCDIPVVVWTADLKGAEHKRENLRQAGIPVLAKPFEIDDLFRCLDEALAVHQVKREGCGPLFA